MANPENKPFASIVNAKEQVIGLSINPKEWSIQALRDVLYHQVLAAERTKIIITSGKRVKILEPEDLLAVKEKRGRALKDFLNGNSSFMKQAQSVTIYNIDPIRHFIEHLPSIDDI